ncbi:MAG: hypothetical protein QM743_03295 [Chitinophagaceae bacterium]
MIEVQKADDKELYGWYKLLEIVIADRVALSDINLDFLTDMCIRLGDQKANISKEELETQKLKFQLQVLKLLQHIVSGRSEWIEDKYSNAGMIYDFERQKQSPISIQEIQKINFFSEDIQRLSKEIMELEKKK